MARTPIEVATTGRRSTGRSPAPAGDPPLDLVPARPARPTHRNTRNAPAQIATYPSSAVTTSGSRKIAITEQASAPMKMELENAA